MNIAQRDEAYRFYLADALKILTANTAGAHGSYITKELRELLYPEPTEPEDNRSCVDIVAEMFQRPTPKKGG